MAIAVGARIALAAGGNKVATGETQPIEQFMQNTAAVPLAAHNLDDVFGDLVREQPPVVATMSVIGKLQRLDVRHGSALSCQR